MKLSVPWLEVAAEVNVGPKLDVVRGFNIDPVVPVELLGVEAVEGRTELIVPGWLVVAETSGEAGGSVPRDDMAGGRKQAGNYATYRPHFQCS